jgi:predicted dehydrogenase
MSTLVPPSPVPPYGVAVLGSGPDARYACERFALHHDFAVVAELDPANSLTSIASLLKNDRLHVIYFAGPDHGERSVGNLISDGLRAHKHIVLRSGVVKDLARHCDLIALATDGVMAVVEEPRRWDEDFLNARLLIDTGKLGPLKRIRLATHELKFPGESFPNGVLRDLGLHWMDQLLAFVKEDLASCHLRRNFSKQETVDDGFVAILEFTGGISAMIEIQTTSLLSSRSGWFVEGTAGAYRNGRFYTRTNDGEIIDEPVERPTEFLKGFVGTLAAAIGGDPIARSCLVSLTHAARVQAVMTSLLANEQR